MAEKNARGKLALLVAVIILWMAAFTAIPALAAQPLVGCDCNQSTDLGLWKGKTNYFTTFTWSETGGLDGSGALKFTGTIDNLTMMYAEGITTEPECISLETNADHYSVGGGAFPVAVIQYDQSGIARKVTGASIASSDPSVFAVQGDQLVPKKTGCSVITAEYEGMSASMMMVCTPADMPSQTEASIPAKYKVAAGGLTGRDGGQAYMHSNSVSAAGDWALRTYVGRGSKWFENGYRYMSGWFYDDMSATTRAALYTSVADSATHNQNFADGYSYENFDWTGNTYYNVGLTAGLVDAGATHYHYKNGSEQVKLAPRSRG